MTAKDKLAELDRYKAAARVALHKEKWEQLSFLCRRILKLEKEIKDLQCQNSGLD